MAKEGKKPIGKIVLGVIVVLIIVGAVGSMGGNSTDRDGFPGKGTDHQQDKEHQVADTQRVRNDQEYNPADIGFTAGTASLAIAAEPNRHADGSDKQYECRRSQPSKHKHHANAHSNNRKQQQTTSTPTGTINGSLSASFHRHSKPSNRL